MIDVKTAEQIDNLASDAVMSTMNRWIDSYAAKSGKNRHEVAAIVGRALIMSGCSFLGVAIGLDADGGLKPGLDCIKAFRDAALDRKRQLDERN